MSFKQLINVKHYDTYMYTYIFGIRNLFYEHNNNIDFIAFFFKSFFLIHINILRLCYLLTLGEISQITSKWKIQDLLTNKYATMLFWGGVIQTNVPD